MTLYDPEGYQVANPRNRFAVSSWMPIKYDPDGSLTLYFQSESPGKDKEANWLPAPKGGFNLLMRLYAPRSEVLTGKWNPPPVTKTEAFMGISGRPPHVIRLRRSPYGTSMPRAGGRGRDGDRSPPLPRPPRWQRTFVTSRPDMIAPSSP